MRIWRDVGEIWRRTEGRWAVEERDVGEELEELKRSRSEKRGRQWKE